MATAHLIHGYLGAGKTTLARRLAAERRAVRYSPDEWMVVLFGHDPPADTFQDRMLRVQAVVEPHEVVRTDAPGGAA